MKSERFKKVIAGRDRALVVFAALDQFLGEKIYINDTDDFPFRIDDRKGEELVENKKFARFKNRGRRRNGRDTFNHDLVEPAFQRCGQQTARWKDTGQTGLLVDDVKIDDP